MGLPINDKISKTVYLQNFMGDEFREYVIFCSQEKIYK